MKIHGRVTSLTLLEPPNPSLHYVQVILSPKRVSRCEGVEFHFSPPAGGYKITKKARSCHVASMQHAAAVQAMRESYRHLRPEFDV